MTFSFSVDCCSTFVFLQVDLHAEEMNNNVRAEVVLLGDLNRVAEQVHLYDQLVAPQKVFVSNMYWQLQLQMCGLNFSKLSLGLLEKPVSLKSDQHPISPYIITPETNIEVTRIQEMIMNQKNSSLLIQSSLSAPWEI